MVGVTAGATLLLSPPSLTSSPTGPATIASLRTQTTDLQMLDRVVESLALLPAEAYSAVIFAPGNPGEVEGYLSAALEKIWNATKAEGVVRIGTIAGEQIKSEALLKGWIVGGEGEEFTLTKPASTTAAAVPLRLRKKAGGAEKAKKLAFLNFDTSDDLINENDLLTESDLAKPVVQPAECLPAPGKRRKACKNCTCGLAEKEAADAAAAEDARKAVTLGVDDLAEIDFTKQGKVVSSCGNCALGDAFRCSGCPYLGMPAFAEAEKGTVEMSWGDDL